MGVTLSCSSITKCPLYPVVFLCVCMYVWFYGCMVVWLCDMLVYVCMHTCVCVCIHEQTNHITLTAGLRCYVHPLHAHARRYTLTEVVEISSKQSNMFKISNG